MTEVSELECDLDDSSRPVFLLSWCEIKFPKFAQ